MRGALLLLLAGVLSAAPAQAQTPAQTPAQTGAQPASPFVPGPVFTDIGASARVASDVALARDAQFKVAFDVTDAGGADKVNPSFIKAARLINILAAAGIPQDHISIAMVLRGPSVEDVLTDTAYAARHPGKRNASAHAVGEMMAHRVVFYVCGQTVTAARLTHADLLAGVKLSLSAMVMHALLQQQGFTENPE